MALATTTTETVTTYHLSLTEEEARVLFVILMNVGGDPNGPRGVSADILSALRVSLDVRGMQQAYPDWYSPISRKIVHTLQFDRPPKVGYLVPHDKG